MFASPCFKLSGTLAKYIVVVHIHMQNRTVKTAAGRILKLAQHTEPYLSRRLLFQIAGWLLSRATMTSCCDGSHGLARECMNEMEEGGAMIQ